MGHGHTHAPATASAGQRRRLAVVLGLTLAVLVVEVVGAALTGSLALLADAGHMATDAAGIALALGAVTLAQRPPGGRRTFGWQRLEILAAVANGLLLIAVAGFVVVQAVRRIGNPPEIDSGPMLVIAGIGLAVNLVGLAVLHQGRTTSLNVRGAYLEVLADALGSVAVVVAALVIAATGWTPADTVASLLIGGLVLPRAWHLLREALDVLLEAAPRGWIWPTSGRTSSVSTASSGCTTCTRGRSPRDCRSSRRTSSSPTRRWTPGTAVGCSTRSASASVSTSTWRTARSNSRAGRTPGTSPPSTTEWDSGGAGAGAEVEASVDHGHHSGMWVPGAPPTWGRMFLPHLDPWSVLAVLSVLGLLVYLAAVLRLRRSGVAWPWWRTLAWVAGSVSLFAVTGTWLNGYSMVLFSVHMAQHMVLSLITPLLLLLAAPGDPGPTHPSARPGRGRSPARCCSRPCTAGSRGS